jgi:exonuclease SbcC
LRILAIRGENLASLGEPFALEFEREPLRSAGLFAIVGETGAGKSTILDALCLALYDKFPRVAAPGGAEGAPDPSGETLAAGDPRAILRRGAGRGFAEADFIARDGRRYRARCEVLRARGKAAGRLQGRGRSLWRIDENGEAVEAVESGVEPVNRRIVELTDLTFEQFRRTALLAQGDFDAFLRADAKERADLLEKITGAEIYGRLSRRAYENAEAARRELATLEARRADIGVMAEEARAATVEESRALAERRAALVVEREETLSALRRHDARVQALTKCEQAEKDCETARGALDALAPQRLKLAELERAEPLRAPHMEARRAGSDLAERRDAARQAAAQAEAARKAQDAAQEKQRAAAETLAAAEAQCARFAPLWREAGELDSRIAALAEEEETARRLVEEADARASRKREAQAALLLRKAEAARQRDAAGAEFELLALARPLSERWREIDDWLEKRAELNGTRRTAHDELLAAEARLERGAKSRAAFDAADKEDSAARAALAAQIETRVAALHRIDEAAASRRLDDVRASREFLRALARAARDWSDARQRAASASAEAARLREEGAAASRDLESRRAIRESCAAQSEEAARLGELAEAVAAPEALRLRAALEEDAPCPVCGATDHPFAHAQDAAQKLVADLRAKKEAARRALAGADADLLAATARHMEARTLQEDAARRVAESEAAAARAAADYDDLRGRETRLDAPALALDAAEQLAARVEAASAEDAALSEQLLAARRLREDIERLRKDSDARHAATEARRAERDILAEEMQRGAEARARLRETLAATAERIESLSRALEPFATLCELTTADLDRDPAGARARLETAGRRYGAARQAFDAATAQLAALELQAASLDAETRAAEEHATDRKEAHAARLAALAKARELRAALLDGEATAAHRARHEAQASAARATLEDARATLSQAEQAQAAGVARNAACTEAAAAAEKALDAARGAFAAALETTGFDETAATTLLALSPQERGDLRETVEAAESRLAAAQAAVAARRLDVEETAAAAPDDASRETLVAHAQALAEEHDALSARLGALQEKLAQDDEARGRAESLSRETEAARGRSRVWDEVNEAIGSASGDKFRRFAQSVTLEQLVELANRRLALLSPRYRLERAGEMGSLGLQIVDRDLGDERRSTRSLSGGERFLASLALALALAGLEGRDSFVDTLFIDEGFGALDLATLDVAIDALETLQGQGRKVGVISHVEPLQQRIAVKVCVERRGGGLSVVRLRAPGFESG